MSDKTLPRLQARYREEIVPTLMEDFGYKNINQVPTIKKVVVNIGMGEANENPKLMDGAVETLRTITGQQPVITRARKSIATLTLGGRQPPKARQTSPSPASLAP